VAAIRFGEVPNNLRSEDVRMRKLSTAKSVESFARKMQTPGSETSQYGEEKKTTSISSVAASEREGAQTAEFLRSLDLLRVVREIRGVVRQL
jgi:hypothetical protein